MRITVRLVLTIVFALALSLSLRVFVVEAVKINGESMLPTFEDGDKTFIFKLMKPKKGDVVFLHGDDDVKVVKRLVATEGDTIEYIGKDVLINGEKDSRYEDLERKHLPKYVAKKNEMYVLGDNINNSSDSRVTHYSTDDYIGKALIYIRGFKIKKLPD